MARRVTFTAGLIIVCAAVEFSVLDYPAIRGVAPDLLLVVTVIVGLLSGPRAGMAVGFFAGVLEGALLGNWIGVFAGAKVIVGYLAGESGRRVFPENLLIMMSLAAALTVVHEAVFHLFASRAGLGTMALDVGGRAAYNGGVALIIGAALRRVRYLLPPEEVTR
ncbi:MAG TPA: rod shape-determining protein MreD [Armatimonadota bacterium]|nr:rod shape-determining protein MreD [Armatimonadota bacterium]